VAVAVSIRRAPSGTAASCHASGRVTVPGPLLRLGSQAAAASGGMPVAPGPGPRATGMPGIQSFTGTVARALALHTMGVGTRPAPGPGPGLPLQC
jgi:hypothetical protein